MKKKLAITLSSALLFALMGCTSTPSNGTETGDATAIQATPIESSEASSAVANTENANNSTEVSSENSITVGDKTISILDDVATTLKTLGDPDPTLSEIGNDEDGKNTGESYAYESPDLRFDTVIKDGKELPFYFSIKDPEIKTSKNIHVMNTESEVIAAYGEPTGTNETGSYRALVYDFDKIELVFPLDESDNPLVKEIIYMNKETKNSINFS